MPTLWFFPHLQVEICTNMELSLIKCSPYGGLLIESMNPSWSLIRNYKVVGVAQWQNTCSVCVRSFIQPLVLQNNSNDKLPLLYVKNYIDTYLITIVLYNILCNINMLQHIIIIYLFKIHNKNNSLYLIIIQRWTELLNTFDVLHCSFSSSQTVLPLPISTSSILLLLSERRLAFPLLPWPNVKDILWSSYAFPV